MEDAVRSRLIQSIVAQLTECEHQASALAREVISRGSSHRRKIEALILRAETQSRSIELFRKIQQLEARQHPTDGTDRVWINAFVPAVDATAPASAATLLRNRTS